MLGSTRTWRSARWLLVGGLAVLLGCDQDPKRIAQPLTKIGGNAAESYANRCAGCHGGDGKGLAGLTPKPQDFTDEAFQAAVTDAEIRKAILGGGGAVGKSVTMPASSDLADKPDVVDGLIAHIRSFRASKPAP
jgi:mono/diheme cytochrome c family protein